TTYYYVTNLQGDVVAILNKAGKAIVEYSYDAWGNVESITGEYKGGLGLRNPLLYRGYVYDRETKLYYLNSRYYDPETGRFLNTDIYPSTGQGLIGNNMYAYCLNNPINCVDPSGQFALLPFLGAMAGGALGGAVISTLSYVVASGLSGDEMTSAGLFNAAVSGALSGAIGGAIGTITGPIFTMNADKAKKVFSLGVGAAMGIKAGIEAEGTSMQRAVIAAVVGAITAASTYCGAKIDAYLSTENIALNAFTNASATMFTGTVGEIASLSAQQVISKKPSVSSRTKRLSSGSRNTGRFYRAIAY
ncbi:MAG: RHS repeat-associated core domain-containing protein, partial [Erysipelotrichaceae bacterium]|nr:RHS repeat-associated core domain-containing protein [Erysipelotrichaceae bacterium]